MTINNIIDNKFVGTGVDHLSSKTYKVTMELNPEDGIDILIQDNEQIYLIDAVSNTNIRDIGMSGTWRESDQNGAIVATGTWSTISGKATNVICYTDNFTKWVAKPTPEYTCQFASYDDFCLIQEVSQNTCGNSHGLGSKGDSSVGFGFYKPVTAP